MLKQLSLREYDDADIIAYLDSLDKGILSRKIRQAIRAQMHIEGFTVNDTRIVQSMQVTAPVAQPLTHSDVEQPNPDLMLGRLLGSTQTGK